MEGVGGGNDGGDGLAEDDFALAQETAVAISLI